MREDKLYARLQPYLKKWGAVDRVENALGSGMWDVHYAIDGVLGWIETKIEKGGLLYFEKFQPNWGKRYRDAGIEQLFVITSGTYHDQVVVYHVSSIVQAYKEKKGKWTVVRAKDLEPMLVLDKPYAWEDLRLLLSGQFTVKSH